MSDIPTVWGVHMGVHVGTEPGKKITLLVAVNFVSQIPKTMILFYLFFI